MKRKIIGSLIKVALIAPVFIIVFPLYLIQICCTIITETADGYTNYVNNFIDEL